MFFYKLLVIIISSNCYQVVNLLDVVHVRHSGWNNEGPDSIKHYSSSEKLAHFTYITNQFQLKNGLTFWNMLDEIATCEPWDQLFPW